MRGVSRAKVVLALVLPLDAACPSPDTEVTAQISSAQLTANVAAGDSLANLDVLVELEAKHGAASVTLDSVGIEALPRGGSSETLSFDGVVESAEVVDGIIELSKNDTGVARILNGNRTNAELQAWCQRPVGIDVEFDWDGDRVSASQDITVQCN